MLIIEVNNSGGSCRLREFGEKIKRLRLAKKISSSEFCGDESEWSIRQLIRIENGESRPTLTKLKYIAERLGGEDYKLMPSYIELDKEYLELKYFLMRTPTYEDETIAQKKESVFDKIFEEYYDRLPEEERFIIPNYSYLALTNYTVQKSPEKLVKLLSFWWFCLISNIWDMIEEICLDFFLKKGRLLPWFDARFLK